MVGIPWSQASTWSRDEARRWFDQTMTDEPVDVVFANGLTSSLESADRLADSNFRFPARVIEATGALLGLRYLTFGSALEVLHDRNSTNPYFASKVRLGTYIRERSAERFDARLTHLRLHTLYGGAAPHPHGFLGQVLASLRTGTPFPMSDGRQFRQYHHVDDIAPAILNRLSRPWGVDRVVQLNGPETFRLVDLATAIFTHFGVRDLLRVGALETPARDVISMPDYRPSPPDLLPRVRLAVPGVIAWLEELLDRPEADGSE